MSLPFESREEDARILRKFNDDDPDADDGCYDDDDGPMDDDWITVAAVRRARPASTTQELILDDLRMEGEFGPWND